MCCPKNIAMYFDSKKFVMCGENARCFDAFTRVGTSKYSAPMRQSQPRSFVKNDATFWRPRFDMNPVSRSSRILASTNGWPVLPSILRHGKKSSHRRAIQNRNEKPHSQRQKTTLTSRTNHAVTNRGSWLHSDSGLTRFSSRACTGADRRVP
jgi:hypothetical protein